MKNLLSYLFGYYPLEQKTSWEKPLNWSDTKNPKDQVILVLNIIASTILEQI